MPEIVIAEADLAMPWVSASDLDDAPDCVDLDQVAQAAGDLLFILSGYQYGSVTETVRPYRVGERCRCGNVYNEVVGSPFAWSTWSGWAGFASCGCSSPSFIALPGPVTAIEEIRVDGVVLAADDYSVWDGTFLVRTEGSWPCCQDLRLPSSEEGTFSIRYTHGPGVPAGGRIAARVLAGELAKAAAGQNCGLNGRVQSVNRDGVSAVVVDDQSFLELGRTGIGVVDLWLGSVNPNGLARGGTIVGPGSALHGLLGQVTVTPAP